MAERKNRKNLKDRGALPGGAAAACVLVAWGVVAFQPVAGDDGGGEPAAGTAREVATALEPVSPPAPPAPPASAATRDAPVPPWKLDERWSQAGELGEGALDRIEKEYQRHEEEGDPFRFRAEMDACRKDLERAGALLEALARDYAADAEAKRSIEVRRQRYAGKLRATRK